MVLVLFSAQIDPLKNLLKVQRLSQELTQQQLKALPDFLTLQEILKFQVLN